MDPTEWLATCDRLQKAPSPANEDSVACPEEVDTELISCDGSPARRVHRIALFRQPQCDHRGEGFRNHARGQVS